MVQPIECSFGSEWTPAEILNINEYLRDCSISIKNKEKYLEEQIAQDPAVLNAFFQAGTSLRDFFLTASKEWFSRVIVENFYRHSRCICAVLFSLMDKDSQGAALCNLLNNQINEETGFLGEVLNEVFALEQKMENRLELAEFVVETLTVQAVEKVILQMRKEPGQEQLAALPYLYLALSKQSVVSLTFGGREWLLDQLWRQESGERTFIVDELFKRSTHYLAILGCPFNVGEKETWTFREFQKKYADAHPQHLLFSQAEIQKIPKIIISLNAKILLSNPFILSLVPFLSDEQLAAYAEHLPEKIRQELLKMHITLTPMSADSLGKILAHASEKDVESVIKDSIEQLNKEMTSLEHRSEAWLNSHEKKSTDGFEISHKLRVLQIHFLRPFIVQNQRSELFKELALTFPKLRILGRRVESAARLLKNSEDKFLIPSEEAFSEGSLLQLTPPVLKLLGISSFDDLAKAGIHSDLDFTHLGLSWQQRDKVLKIQKRIQGLCGRENEWQEDFWRPLFEIEGAEDESKGLVLEDRFYDVLEAQIFKNDTEGRAKRGAIWEEFTKILSFIVKEFPDFKSSLSSLAEFGLGAGPVRESRPKYKERVMKLALRECIKFARTHQFGYVVYRHMQKMKP